MSSRIRPNQVLLLKMTPGVGSETQALLGRRGSSHEIGSTSTARRAATRDVLVIDAGRRPDEVRLGRQRYDLHAPAGRQAFLGALGLDGQRAGAAAEILARAPDDARDELGQLVRLLSWADRGLLDVRRVVLSGHFTAQGLRGNQPGQPHERAPYNGVLRMQDLAAVVALFPRAAERVQHLMIAVCYSARSNPAGGAEPDVLASYRKIFPRLTSVTGYGYKAPRSGAGAETHLRRWARATAADKLPERDRIFGACVTPRTARDQRNVNGAVFTERGPQRCG